MSEGKYSLRPDGLYYGTQDDNSVPGTRVCGRIEVAALLRDGDSTDWARLLVWHDLDGVRHEFALKMSALLSNRADVLSHLADGGLEIRSSKLLIGWLQTATSDVRARRVSRTGWHEDPGTLCFVLSNETVGQNSDKMTFLEAAAEPGYAQAGTLQEWKDEVATACQGNSRLVLSVSAAFAAPLLYLMGYENGGFHLVGRSSSGKTTALRVAASVFGGEQYVQRWRATDNGLESIAASRNDTLLVLDELAQADPRRLGDVVYMLANGQGKVRADRSGDARQRKAWRLLFLSSGETTLAQQMTLAGTRVRAGQEVRFVDVPADAGEDMGLFENLHGSESPAEFAQRLAANTARYYGVASREFIARCIQFRAGLPEKLVADAKRIAAVLLAKSESMSDKVGGQVARVTDRFALVAAAGEFASSLGLTGWVTGEATLAAQKCMQAWLEVRGTAGNSEPEAMVSAVRAFITRHGESRFTNILLRPIDFGDDRQPRVTSNRAGWRLTNAGRTEFLIDPDVFRDEVCAGFDPIQVCRVLAERGCLKTGEEAGKLRYTLHRSTPDTLQRKRRFYVVTDAIWAE